MEGLPDEVLLRIVYFTNLKDRFQLSLVCQRLREIVLESWKLYGLKLGWIKSVTNMNYIAVCKSYVAARKVWFNEKLNQYKLYTVDHSLITAINYIDCLVLVASKTELSLFKQIPSGNSVVVERVLSKSINITDNTTFLTDSYTGAIDDETSELLIIDLNTGEENRLILPKIVSYECCHILDNNRVVFITECGKVIKADMGGFVYSVLRDDEDDCIFSKHFDSKYLFASFWSSCFAKIDLVNRNSECVYLKSNVSALCFFNKCVFFGTDDGDVGRIEIKDFSALNEDNLFKRQHSGSIYAASANSRILVTCGCESEVVFWSHNGEVLCINQTHHIGIVRHVFLWEWLMITAGDAHLIVIWDPISLTMKQVLHHNPLKIKFMLANEFNMCYGTPDSKYAILASVR